ncbi:MAG TPA: N-acetylmuramoyl-L-alanine amidase [Symbiobacteriaceae bacterium]|nr:N-acetylmuramoyl-L-alanine amidase [Symbiobacteriaceae bacterium]
MRNLRRFLRPLLPVLALLLLVTSAFAKPAEEFARGDKLNGPLGTAFTAAAAEYGVPVEILVALAYSETRLTDYGGKPSVANGYGVMHLVDNPKVQTLQEAVKLTHMGANELRNNLASNIKGGAAVLASYARQQNAGALPLSTEGWFEAVAQYGHMPDEMSARDYASQVYQFINQGIDVSLPGEEIRLEPRAVVPILGKYEGLMSIQSTDYGPALWVAASSSNYTVANRESDYNINYVIIHVTQGSYSSAINWFANPSAKVSAHYTVRSSDGQITQSVREKDIAWHAGNWTYNTQSIGIEHEGYVDNCAWFTDAMYRASAALTRSVANKYGIPKDRAHILGHNEVPGATHTDPGGCWNWTYYMQLVNETSTWSTIVDNTSARYSGNWAVSTYSSQRYGTDYLYANPQAVSDAAYYSVNIPSNGNYEIYAWYPSNSGYNNSTPVVIWKANSAWTGTESVTKNINQQTGGGQWVSLGVYPLLAGQREIIAVSRWTSGTGYVIADAFKIVKR